MEGYPQLVVSGGIRERACSTCARKHVCLSFHKSAGVCAFHLPGRVSARPAARRTEVWKTVSTG